MKNRLKITGVYDRKTLKMIGSLGIDQVGFDFRTKSFNFLQQYAFLEIMESSYQPFSWYYLQFQNEVDFVIRKIVDDLFEQIDRGDNNVFLEFSDGQSGQFYDQFDLPFCWHFQDFESFSSVIEAKNLREITLDYSLLEHLKNGETLHEFNSVFKEMTQGKDLNLTLGVDWDSDIFPSLVEYFDFNSHSFAINQKTEISYRNVDMIAVKRHLQHYL